MHKHGEELHNEISGESAGGGGGGRNPPFKPAMNNLIITGGLAKGDFSHLADGENSLPTSSLPSLYEAMCTLY